MNIILIGFMGSGKSSVAKKLSHLLKLPILEMDELVFHKTKTKNMHEVFAKGGELLLRETEIAIAQEYTSIGNSVISTGAGVVQNKIILDYLKKADGIIFFLNASFQTIATRLANDDLRPLFTNSIKAESLYHFRQPLYLNYGDHMIEVDRKSLEEIAQEIVEILSSSSQNFQTEILRASLPMD